MTPSAREPHDEQVSEANLVAQVKTYEALVAALDRGQEVFDALPSADDPGSARSRLQELLEIDEEAAQSVINMQLRRLPASEGDRIMAALQERRATLPGARGEAAE
jgi:DNA gyrase subunit A